jgi:hypothetical protein
MPIQRKNVEAEQAEYLQNWAILRSIIQITR